MEALTRRTLLRGAALVGLAVPAMSVLDVSPVEATAGLSRNSFSPLVGRSFQVRGATGLAAFTLNAIADLPNSPKSDVRRFSLQFQQTAGRLVHQGTWTFRQASLGTFRLFVVPVGNLPRRFEAVFNNL